MDLNILIVIVADLADDFVMFAPDLYQMARSRFGF